MTTVINNPGDGEGSNSVFGMVIGVIMFFVVVGVFIVYILPMIKNSRTAETNDIKVDVTLPVEEGKAP